jgi:hypothetical protein
LLQLGHTISALALEDNGYNFGTKSALGRGGGGEKEERNPFFTGPIKNSVANLEG